MAKQENLWGEARWKCWGKRICEAEARWKWRSEEMVSEMVGQEICWSKARWKWRGKEGRACPLSITIYYFDLVNSTTAWSFLCRH